MDPRRVEGHERSWTSSETGRCEREESREDKVFMMLHIYSRLCCCMLWLHWLDEIRLCDSPLATPIT